MTHLYPSAALFLAITLSGCGGGNSPPDASPEILRIVSDFTFTRDLDNVRLVVAKPNVTIDLAGHTLTTRGAYTGISILASNVTVRNGRITGMGYATGIQVQSCVREADIAPMQEQGAAYESVLYARCIKGTVIEDMTLTRLRMGVYLSDYTQDAVLSRLNASNNDRMGVYLAPSTRGNTVQDSVFTNNGYREVEDAGRPRGSISCDGCVYNVFARNVFQIVDKPYKRVRTVFPSRNYRVPELEFYRNCGEPTFGLAVAMPRIQGADHNLITDNTFKNVGLAIHFQYRQQHQLSNCVPPGYADKSDYNTVSNSRRVGTGVYVLDDGVGNVF